MYVEIGIDNTGLITLKGLKDKVTDAFIDSGVTVEATLYDSAGNEVAGQSWPLALSYVAGSNGNYQGLLSPAAQRVRGQTYLLKVTVTDGTDKATLTKEIRSTEREDF